MAARELEQHAVSGSTEEVARNARLRLRRNPIPIPSCPPRQTLHLFGGPRNGVPLQLLLLATVDAIAAHTQARTRNVLACSKIVTRQTESLIRLHTRIRPSVCGICAHS